MKRKIIAAAAIAVSIGSAYAAEPWTASVWLKQVHKGMRSCNFIEKARECNAFKSLRCTWYEHDWGMSDPRIKTLHGIGCQPSGRHSVKPWWWHESDVFNRDGSLNDHGRAAYERHLRGG